jgi:hypothetical protein
MKATLLLAALVLSAGSTLAADLPYHLIKEIPVGGEGGWDYLSVGVLVYGREK